MTLKINIYNVIGSIKSELNEFLSCAVKSGIVYLNTEIHKNSPYSFLYIVFFVFNST